ncbi:OB-fold domain-containing protein [Streptomyces sp. NPDC051577]|uniref:Zn-ribbon domain-containing OB-fold protein n=1 Tax=Streptomyces sp. NPDC051577 TaxID=3155166 RepID=UPI00343FD826
MTAAVTPSATPSATPPATPLSATTADAAVPGTDALLLPVPDEDGAPFWEYAARGELRVQACSDCGAPRFPPRPCCPHCQSFASAWRLTNGRGRIWSYVRPHPPLLPAYAAQAPYNVILVELADAPRIRLVGNLVTAADAPLDSVDPARLRIGARVQVVFTETGGMAVPRWILEKS